ncbi:MAG: hypothetical protein FWG72_10785 [Oscillospiraceae bacterium]|nr:hypothetical protein [Oscillospiraceae bacterium]
MPDNNIVMMTGPDGRPMPMIGCDWFHYAKLMKETADEPAEYGKAERIPGLVNVGLANNVQTAALHADNSVYVTASQYGDRILTVGLAGLPLVTKAEWMGQEYKAGGMTVGQLNPIEMAVMLRKKKANGAYRYEVYYKAKPAPGDTSTETQGATINFQTEVLTLGLASLIHSGKYEYLLETDGDDFPEGLTPKIIEEELLEDPLWRAEDWTPEA